MAILYINDEHCTSVEQLQSYFTRLGEGSVYEDILDYGRHGEISLWLREKGVSEYADGLDAIEKKLGDAEFVMSMSKVLSGEAELKLVKKPYGECFSVEGVEIEDRGDNAEVMVSINVHSGVNESYEIKVSSNWGTKAEPFNPSEHDEGRVDTMRFQYHRRAGKGSFGDVRIEVEGEKIDVGNKSSTSQACTANTINGHEYVDLGLPSGLKWATCNVGADSPEEYGDYYAWGETYTKDEYKEDNCDLWDVEMEDIGGDPEYDVATSEWGDDWRLPTEEDFNELVEECEWKWMKKKGVYGMRVKGPNGNSIFLPAAGFRDGSSPDDAGENGCYWSSTPDESNSYYACGLDFDSGDQEVNWNFRNFGHSVRPVSE